MDILLTASFKNGLFCNGLQQNIVFLAELLSEIGHNPTIAISHPKEDCVDPPSGINMIEESHIKHNSYDYLLNTSWLISEKDVLLMKSKNSRAKNVHIHYGNRMLADIEQCVRDDTRALSNKHIDEIWVSPHYSISEQYLKSYYNNDRVLTIPYIWSPKYIDIHERIWNKAGESCKYNESKVKNIAILEPNLNMTKNCIPSILAVEEAFRIDPESFNKLNVYCSRVLRDKNYFKSFIWNLDLQKNSKVVFNGRRTVSKIFAKECSVVVSHQLLNALNYTYLEALHCGIPLIHNSEFIKEAGYYYPDYETQTAGRLLSLALSNHGSNMESYMKSAKSVINKYSPQNPQIIKQYKKLFI